MVCHLAAALIVALPALFNGGGAFCVSDSGCLLHGQLVAVVVLSGAGHCRPGGLIQVNFLDHLLPKLFHPTATLKTLSVLLPGEPPVSL